MCGGDVKSCSDIRGTSCPGQGCVMDGESCDEPKQCYERPLGDSGVTEATCQFP